MTNGNGKLSAILYTGLLAYLVAIGGSMIYLQVAVASMTSTLSLSTDDRYRKSNAEADFRLRDLRLDEIERRLARQENGR